MSAFGVILVSIGLLAMSVVLTARMVVLRQRSWRKVSGEVTKAEVQLIRENYGPIVEYKYSVDGRSFHGWHICSMLATSSFRGSAEEIASRYRVGVPVDVYVDPGNSPESVLVPGSDFKYFIFLAAFASLSLIVGVGMLVTI